MMRNSSPFLECYLIINQVQVQISTRPTRIIHHLPIQDERAEIRRSTTERDADQLNNPHDYYNYSKYVV